MIKLDNFIMYLSGQMFSHLGRTEQKVEKLLNLQELMLQHMGMTRAGFKELSDDIQLLVKSYIKLVQLNELLADGNKRILVECSCYCDYRLKNSI